MVLLLLYLLVLENQAVRCFLGHLVRPLAAALVESMEEGVLEHPEIHVPL